MPIKISTLSSKSKSGKTTALILTAGEYASQGKKVLLIDADPCQNLISWWKRCKDKDNVPSGIIMRTASTRKALDQIMSIESEKFDILLIDAPAIEGVLANTIISNSDVIITPIQPAHDEIQAVREAAETSALIAEETGRPIPLIVYRTRINILNRGKPEYRFIGPFIENMRDNDYDAHLLKTELKERKCYSEIRSGLGTLQMLKLTETVKKGRLEVKNFVRDIDAVLNQKTVVHC